MHLVDKTSQEISQCDRSKKGNSWESYLHGEPTRSGFVSNTHIYIYRYEYYLSIMEIIHFLSDLKIMFVVSKPKTFSCIYISIS